jgi:DNA-binding transcriptional regulator GbsR (MarR family)
MPPPIPPPLQKIHDQFVEKMGFLGTLFGFNKLLGQIYAVLYLSPKAVALEVLMDALHVSKASISTNIRELEKWGGCKKVWVKGDRKDYYEAETDFRVIFSKRLVDALKRRVSMVGAMAGDAKKDLKSSASDLKKEDKALLLFFEERVRKIEKTKSKLEFFMNTVLKLL